jgi:hypothetical protein
MVSIQSRRADKKPHRLLWGGGRVPESGWNGFANSKFLNRSLDELVIPHPPAPVLLPASRCGASFWQALCKNWAPQYQCRIARPIAKIGHLVRLYGAD